MRKLKLYLETSVWNFFFADDAPEKRDITKEFFTLVMAKKYDVYISEVVYREINRSPEKKKEQLIHLIKKCPLNEVTVTLSAEKLAEKYLERKIIPKVKVEDALHVAVATISELDAVISWNYRHLSNLRKSELFNGVNNEMGYDKPLVIISPVEVAKYEI